MPAILVRSFNQAAAQLIQRARHADRTPTKPVDRKEHDARIRESDEAIKRCLWAFAGHAGVEL